MRDELLKDIDAVIRAHDALTAEVTVTSWIRDNTEFCPSDWQGWLLGQVFCAGVAP